MPGSGGAARSSLVWGVLACCCLLGPIAAVPALVYGHLAQLRMLRRGGIRQERQAARLGLLLGYFSLLMFFVAFGFVVWRSPSPYAGRLRLAIEQMLPADMRENIAANRLHDPRWYEIESEALARYLQSLNPGGRVAVIAPSHLSEQSLETSRRISGIRAAFPADFDQTAILRPAIPEEIQTRIGEIVGDNQPTPGSDAEPLVNHEVEALVTRWSARVEAWEEVGARVPKETDILILLCPLPEEINRMSLWADAGDMLIGAIVSQLQPGMMELISTGILDAVVLNKPDDDFGPAEIPRDIDEAFGLRKLLVTPGNLEILRGKYPGLFPAEPD